MSTGEPAGEGGGGGGGRSTPGGDHSTGTPVGVAGATPGSQSGTQHPPPSPLSGCYLLVVLPEPHTAQHKDLILNRLGKGFLSWDKDSCHVDLEKELQALVTQAPEGEEARNGERLIQYATENLVTEVLIHPQTNTLLQCIRNLLASFTKHRHIIHAGYTFSGNGSWILQDGTFSLADFLDAFSEHDVQRVLRAYENSVTVDIHCANVGDWTTQRLAKEICTRSCRVRVNPDDVLTAGVPAIASFTNYVGQYLVSQTLDQLMEPSDVVGNIRFSHPTLYVFPGGQGDAALFGINGFNMLVDGGFARKSCFWDFARHLDRLDAVLLTRINNSNIGGMSSVLRKKQEMHVYPQIGHFFCNLVERRQANSPDGDKDVDPLILNLTDIGQEMMVNLRHINLRAHPCYRDLEPINLYHKVGHGTLDMYILSPSKDAREVRDFLAKWHSSDSKLFAGSHKRDPNNVVFPIQNLVSICALLVWQPANPEDTITRILFPGSTPQVKIFEGLERLKHLEFMKHPVCSARTLSPSTSLAALKEKSNKQKTSILDRSIEKEKDAKRASDYKKEKKDPETKALKTAEEPAAVVKSAVPSVPIIPTKQPAKVEVKETKSKKVVENKKIIEKETKLESRKTEKEGKTEVKKVEKETKEIKKEVARKEVGKVEKHDIETKKTDIIKTETEKTVITKESKPKPEPKKKEVKESSKPVVKTKTETILRQAAKPAEKKPKPSGDKKDVVKSSPTTPKKMVNGTATRAEIFKPSTKTFPKTTSKTTTSTMPAKSAKDANNRKVVESKNIALSSQPPASTVSSAPASKTPSVTAKPKATERKPISRRPKTGSPSKARLPGSPAKSTRSTPTASVKSDKDGVIRRSKGDKGTADSSTVSTPSAVDAESVVKLIDKTLTEKSDDLSIDSIESKVLADLKEEREVVEEIEAVLCKAERIETARKEDQLEEGDDEITAEATDKKDDATEDDVTAEIEDAPKKIGSRKESQEFTEEDEYLIVEKEEIYTEDSAQSGEGEQKHLLDEVESEKVKKREISKDLDLQEEEESKEQDEAEEKEKDEEPEKKIKFHQQTEVAALMEKPTDLSPEHKEQLGEEVRDIIAYATRIAQKSDERDDSGKKDSEDATTKEPSSPSRDRLDSSEKKTTDSEMKSEVEPRNNLAPEKREESQDRISTLESGATTTAPTLPEDERIPLDEIKEVVDEKHFPRETKGKEVEVMKTTIQPEVSQPLPPSATIKSFDIREPIPAVQRDIVKTPDEVADLPMHEEVDPKLYQMDDFEKGKEEKVPETPETKEPPTPPVKEQKGMFSFFGKVADTFEKGIDKLTRKTKKDSDRDSDEKSSKSSSPKETKPQDEPVAAEIDMEKVFAKVGKLEPFEAFEKARPHLPADIKVASIKETATFLQQEIKETRLDSVPGIQRDLEDDVEFPMTEQQRTPSKFDDVPRDVIAQLEEQIEPVQEKVAEAPKLRDEISQPEIDPIEDTKEVEALLEEASKKFVTVKDSLRDSLESLEDKIEDEIVDRPETGPAKDLVKNTLAGVAERLEEIRPRGDDSAPDTKVPEKVKFEIEKDSDEPEDESEEYAGPYRDVKEAVRDIGEVLAGTAGIEIDDKPKDVIEIVKKVAEVLKDDDLLLSGGILLHENAKVASLSNARPDARGISEEEIIMPKKVGITEEFPLQEELEEMLDGGIARPLPVYERAGGVEVAEEPCIKVMKDKVDITSPVSQDDKSLGRDVKDLCEDLMKDEDAGLRRPSKDEVCSPKDAAKEEKRIDVMDAGIEEVCTRKEAKREIYEEEDEARRVEEMEQPEIVFEQKLSPAQAEIVMVTPDSAPTSPKFSGEKVYEKELEDAAKDDVPVSEIPADIKEFIGSNADVYDIIGEVIVKGRKITIEIIEYIVVVKKVSREHVIYIIEEIIINKGIPPESVVENIELLKGQESTRDLIPLTKRIEIEEYIVTEYIAKGKRITVQVVEEIAIKKVVPKRIVIEIIEEIIIKRKISRESVYEMIEEDFIKQVRPIYDEYDRPSERESPTDKLATSVDEKPSIDDITREKLGEHPAEDGDHAKPVEEMKEKLLSPVGAAKERKTEIFDEKDLDEGKLIDDFVNIPSKDAVTSFLLEERRSSDEDKTETTARKSSVTKEFVDDSMKDSGDDFEAVEQEYKVVKSTTTPFDGVTKSSVFDGKDEEDIVEAIEDDIDEVVEAAEKFVEETKEKSPDRKESVQLDETVAESVDPAKETVDKDVTVKAVHGDVPAREIDAVIRDVDDAVSEITDATEKYLVEDKEKTTGVKTDLPKVSTDSKEIPDTVKDTIEDAMKRIDKKLPGTDDIVAEVDGAKTDRPLDKEGAKPEDAMKTPAEKYSPVDESASKLSTPEKPVAASITDHPSSMQPEIPETREIPVVDEPDKKQADVTTEKNLVSHEDKKPDEPKDRIADGKTTLEETVPEIVSQKVDVVGKPEKEETVSVLGTISPVTESIGQTKPTTDEVTGIAKPATLDISRSEIPEPKTDDREGTGKVTETADKVVPVHFRDIETPKLSDSKDSEKPEDSKKPEVETDTRAKDTSDAVISDIEADSADEEIDHVRKKRSLVPDLPEIISTDTPEPSTTDITPAELAENVDKLAQVVKDAQKPTAKDLAEPEAVQPTEADKFEKLPQSTQDDEDKPIDDANTVRRMVVTASSEDGGQETELCPTGSITFTKAVTPDDSLNISTRSTPDKDSLNDISVKSTPDKDSLRDISTKSTPEKDSLKDASPKSTPDRDSLLLEKDSLHSEKSTPERDSISEKSVSDLKDDKVTPEDSLEKSIPDAPTRSTVPKDKVDEDAKVPSDVRDQPLQEFVDHKTEKPTDSVTSKEPEETDQEFIPRDERGHPVKSVELAHEPEEKDRIPSPAIDKSRSPSITSDHSGKDDLHGEEQPKAAPAVEDTKPVSGSFISSEKVDEPAITDAAICKDKSPSPDIDQVDVEKLKDKHLPVDDAEKEKSPSPTKDKITPMPELPVDYSVKPKDTLDDKMQKTTPSSLDIDEAPVKAGDLPASTAVVPVSLDDKDDDTHKLPKDKSSIASRTPSLIPSEKSDDRDIPSDKDVDDSTPSPASDKTTDKSRSTSISSDKLPEPHVPDVPLPKDKSPSPTIDKPLDKSRTSSISSEQMEEKDIPESGLHEDRSPSRSVCKIDEGKDTPKTIDKLESMTKPDGKLPKDAPTTVTDEPSEETKLPSPTPIKVDEGRPDEDSIKDRSPSPATDRLPDKSQQTSVVTEKLVPGEVVDTKTPQDSAPVDKVSEKSRSPSPISAKDEQKPLDDKVCKDRSPSPPTEKPTDKSRSPSVTAPKEDEKDTSAAEVPKEKSPSQLAEKLSDEVKLPGITSVKFGGQETEDEKTSHDTSLPIADEAMDKDVPKDGSPVEKMDRPDVKLPKDVSPTDEPTQKSRSPSLVSEKLDEPKSDHDQVTKDKSSSPLMDEPTHKSRTPSITGERMDERDKSPSSDKSKLSSPVTEEIKEQQKPDEKVLKERSPSPTADKLTDETKTTSSTVDQLDTKDTDDLKEPKSTAPAETPVQKTRTPSPTPSKEVDLDDRSKTSDKLVKDQAPVMDETKTPSPIAGKPETKVISDSELPKDVSPADTLAQKSRSPSLTSDKVGAEKTPDETIAKEEPTSPMKLSAESLTPISDAKLPKEESLKTVETTQKSRSPSPASEQLVVEETLDAKTMKDRSPSPTKDKSRTPSITGVELDTKEKPDTKLTEGTSLAEKPTDGSRSPSLTPEKLDDHKIPVDKPLDESLPSPPSHEPSDTVQPVLKDKSSPALIDEESEKSKPSGVVTKLPDDEKKPDDKISIDKSPSPTTDIATDKSGAPSIPSEKLHAERIPDVKAPSDATSAVDQVTEEPKSPGLAGEKPDDRRIPSPSSDAPIAKSRTPSISDAGKQDLPKDEKSTDPLLFATTEEIPGTPKLPFDKQDEHGILDDKPSREGSVSPASNKLAHDEAPKDVLPQPLIDKDTDEPVSLTAHEITKEDVPHSVTEKSRSPSPVIEKTTDSDKPGSIVFKKPDTSDVPDDTTTTDKPLSEMTAKPADEIKKPELETTKPDKPQDFQTELPKGKSPSPILDKAVDEVKKIDVTADEKLDEPRESLDKVAKEKSTSPTVDQVIDKTPTASITITKPEEPSILDEEAPKDKSRSPTPEERTAKSPTKTGIDPEESDIVDAKPVKDQSPTPAVEKALDVSEIPSPSDAKQGEHPVREKVESKDKSPMPVSDEPADTSDIVAKKLDVDVPDAKIPTGKSPSPIAEQTTGKSRSTSPAKELDPRIIPEKKSPASPTTEQITDEPTITLDKLGDPIASIEKLRPDESLSSPKGTVPDQSTPLGFISVPEVAKDITDVKTHEDESASPTSGIVTDKTEPSSPTISKLQEQIPSVDTSKVPETAHDEPKTKDVLDASLPKQKSPAPSLTEDSEPSKPTKTTPLESSTDIVAATDKPHDTTKPEISTVDKPQEKDATSHDEPARDKSPSPLSDEKPAEKESAKVLDQHVQETEPSKKPDAIVDKMDGTVKPAEVIPEKLSVDSLDVKDDKDRSHTPTSERSDKFETSSIAGDKVEDTEVSSVPVATGDKPDDKSKLVEKSDEKLPTVRADSVVDKSRSPSIGSEPDEQKELIDAGKTPSVSGDKPVDVLIPTLVQDKSAGKLDVQQPSTDPTPEFDKCEAKSRSPSIISDDVEEKPAEATDKPVDEVKAEIPKGEKTEESRRPSSVTEVTPKHPEPLTDKQESPKPDDDQVEKHVHGVIQTDKPKSLGLDVSEIEDGPQNLGAIPAKPDEKLHDEIEKAKSPLLGTDPSLSKERSPSIASDKSKSPIPIEDGAEDLSRSGSTSSVKSDQKETIEQPKSPSSSTKTDDKLSKLEGIDNESFTMVDDVPKTVDEIDEFLVKGVTDVKSPRDRSPSYDKTPKDRSRSHSLFDTGDRTPLGRSRAASLFDDKLDDKIAHLDLSSSRPSICEEIEDDKLHKDDGSKLLPDPKTTAGIGDRTSPRVSDHGSTESLASDESVDVDVSPAKRADIERHIIEEFISKDRKIPSRIIDELVSKQGVTRHVIIEIIEYIIVKRKIPRESVLDIAEPEEEDQVCHRGSSDSLAADELLDDTVVTPAKRMDIEHHVVDEFITKNKKMTSHVIDELVRKHGITRYIIIEIIEELIVKRRIPRDSVLDADIEKPQDKGTKPADQKREPEAENKMDAGAKKFEPKDGKSPSETHETPEIPETTRELGVGEAMKPDEVSKTVIGQEKSESPITDEPADSEVRTDIERYIVDEFICKNKKLTSHVIDEVAIKHGVTRYVVIDIVEEIIVKRKIPRVSVLDTEVEKSEDTETHREDTKIVVDEKTPDARDAADKDEVVAPTKSDEKSRVIGVKETPEIIPDSTVSLAKRMDVENYVMDEFVSKNKKITSRVIDEIGTRQGVARYIVIEIIEKMIVERKISMDSLVDVAEIERQADDEQSVPRVPSVEETLHKDDDTTAPTATSTKLDDSPKSVSEHGSSESLASDKLPVRSDVPLTKRKDIENYIVNEFVSKKKKITSQIVEEIATKHGVSRYIVIEIIEEIVIERKISRDSLLDIPLDREEIGTEDKTDTPPSVGGKDSDSSVPRTIVNGEPEVEELTVHAIKKRSVMIDEPVEQIPENVVDSKTPAPQEETPGDLASRDSKKIDDKPTHSRSEEPQESEEPIFASPEKPSSDGRDVTTKIIPDVTTSEIKDTDRLEKEIITITDAKRVEIEEYIVEQYISKNKKITREIIEEIVIKKMVPSYIIVEIIEEIIIKRKLSRTLVLDYVDEASSDKEDIEPIDRSATSSISDKDDTKLRISPDDRFDIATGKSTPEISSAKDQTIDFSGKSTPELKSSLLSEKYSDKSGYSTPDMRQFDEKSGKSTPDLKTEYESQFHKAFVGGMTEIRTTHITTLSGKSTPDIGSKHEDTPETGRDEQAKPSAPTDKVESSHGEAEACAPKSWGMKTTESTSPTSQASATVVSPKDTICSSEDSKLATTTSEVTIVSSKLTTTISESSASTTSEATEPLPGSRPTAETSIPRQTMTSPGYVTTVTSSQSETEPQIIRREIVVDPETEVITRTIRHVTESEESEPEVVTRVIRGQITDYETPETEVITRTVTRYVTESEDSEPEVVRRVIRREIIDSESPEKEVITRTIRHVIESEESEPEVVTRVIRREITDYEAPETEVITRTVTRHVTESEESEPEVVRRVIRREIIDSESPEKEVITRTVRRVIESEEDEPEIITKVIRREITDLESPEREVITRTIRHVEEVEESEPEVVTRIVKREAIGPLDEAVTITTRTTKVIEQEDAESDYSDDPSEFVGRRVKLDGQPEVIKRIISREGTPEVTETVTTKTTRTIVSEEVPISETVMKTTTTTTLTSDIEKPEVVTRTISREGTPEFSETIKRTTKTITSDSGPEYVTKIISREGTPDILKTADVKRIVTTVTTITGPDGESITTKDVKESSDKLDGEDLLEKLIDSSHVDKSGKSTSDVKTSEERFVSETPEGLKTEEIIKRTVTTVTSTSGISTPDVKTFIDSEKSTPERAGPEDVEAPSKEYSTVGEDKSAMDAFVTSVTGKSAPEHPVSSVVKDPITEDESYSGKSSPRVSVPKDGVFSESTGKSTPEISLSPFVRDGGVAQSHLSGRSTPDRKSDGKSRTATPEGFRSGEVIRTIITTTRTISEDGEIITTTKEVTEATNEQGQTIVLAEKTNVKVEDSLPGKDSSESAITSVMGSIKASESKRGSSSASDIASERDLGPMSPRSDVSSGHSRGTTHVWESSEERHTYSDDEPPSSPLSATSQLGYSPRMGRYELPIDRESHKLADLSSSTMTGSFYGDLPKDSPTRSTTKSSREKSVSHKNSEPIPIQGSKEYSSKRFYVEKDFAGGYEYKTESKKYVDDADLDFDLAMKGHKERLGDGFASHHYSNGAAASYTNGTSDGKHTAPTEDLAPVEKKKIDPMAASFMEERRTSDDGEQKDKDPLEGWGKPLCLPSPKPPKQFNLRRPAASNSTETLGPESLNFDVINNWGEPLRLPSPAPPTNEPSNKGAPGTPKKERKQPKKVVAENNKNKKRSESPSKNDKKTKDSKNKVQPVYMDLTYVPHHGNSYYSNLEFFKRIRARYYVFSGTEPSREVYDALLEAKKTWEDKNLEVTMIPTYDTDTLGYWVADNEEALAANHIDLSPSASRCTINLQDHETSCSAYRLEF